MTDFAGETIMEFTFGIALGIGVGLVMKDFRPSKFADRKNVTKQIDSLGKKAKHQIESIKKTKSHIADVRSKATKVHDDVVAQIKGLG